MNLKDEAFKLVTTAHRLTLRLTNGRVMGRVGSMPVVVLTTTGRRSGATRTTILTAPVVDGERVVLVASYGGDRRHPAWFLNLREHPDVRLQIGSRDRPMRARIAGEEERAELWPRIVAAYSGYGRYQERTDREIPVVVLEPRPG
ncbi:MAG TPA: nitroreductase family deazaflavin-dependent oxidoreductase [Acidimicrobiales bacterium]|nr:nitroreductase family deazaflavin-dependent oxidoreductase [Acidimicrobiales bacterium]